MMTDGAAIAPVGTTRPVSPALGEDASSKAATGRIIVVASASGGAGTTTLAVNLAVALALRAGDRSRVNHALVDGSLRFADVRVLFDIPTSSPGILDVATSSAALPNAIRAALYRCNRYPLVVLPGTVAPEDGERITADRFQAILEALRALYPVTIVDLGRELGEATLTALELADEVLLVARNDMLSLKNAWLVLGLAERLGLPASKMRLVLDFDGAAGGISVAEAERAFGRPFDARVPADPDTAATALNHGRPFAIDGRHTRLGRALDDLAALVEGGWVTPRTKPARSRLGRTPAATPFAGPR